MMKDTLTREQRGTENKKLHVNNKQLWNIIYKLRTTFIFLLSSFTYNIQQTCSSREFCFNLNFKNRNLENTEISWSIQNVFLFKHLTYKLNYTHNIIRNIYNKITLKYLHSFVIINNRLIKNSSWSTSNGLIGERKRLTNLN